MKIYNLVWYYGKLYDIIIYDYSKMYKYVKRKISIGGIK